MRMATQSATCVCPPWRGATLPTAANSRRLRNVFHRGPETYTLLLVYSGAGSIAGALGVAALEKLKGQGINKIIALTP